MLIVTNITPHNFINNSENIFNISSYETKQTIDLTSFLLSIFLSCFCIITVFGNALVIYAVIQERYLKSATYYYMASLACADLFVGLIVMPFAIVQVIFGEYWPFGKTYCDLWHSIDVCASTASILDLCVIALDRYSAITNPISYHRAFFVKRWPYLLVAVWLCSGLISFPAIAYWRLVVRQYEINRCLFPDDIYYILVSSFISFYIPLFVMIFVYIRIYRAAIKQLHAFKTGVKLTKTTKFKKKRKLNNNNNHHHSPTLNISSDVCLRIHRGKYHGVQIDQESSLTDNSLSHYSLTNDNTQFSINKKQISSDKSRQSLGKRLTKFSKEQKATITLAYVMGIFVLCWLPFFLYNPLTAISKLFLHKNKSLNKFQQILIGNDLIFQVFTWLGYINSSVNPIIYAYSSREFRRAFIKYLCRCFPTRLRNFLMSYHNLHLLRYRHKQASSIISNENLESNSDNTNKQIVIPSSSSIPTTILINIQSQKQQSKLAFLTNYSNKNTNKQKQQINDKPKTNIIVDYCTLHDVAVSRVTCL